MSSMSVSETTMQPAKTSTRFWDRIANRYSRTPIADEATYQTKLRITQDHLRPDMDVLEFGCGTGSTALVHAPVVNRILAIDISSKMIGIARDKAKIGTICKRLRVVENGGAQVHQEGEVEQILVDAQIVESQAASPEPCLIPPLLGSIGKGRGGINRCVC